MCVIMGWFASPDRDYCGCGGTRRCVVDGVLKMTWGELRTSSFKRGMPAGVRRGCCRTPAKRTSASRTSAKSSRVTCSVQR